MIWPQEILRNDMRDNKTMRLSEILDKHYKRLKYGRGENSRGLGDASPKDTEPLDKTP